MTKSNQPKFSSRSLALVVVIALFIYAVVPQLGVFKKSWPAFKQADTNDLMLAIGLIIASYLFASLTYCLLANRRLSYWRTFGVQVAASFVNRLLPAGIGGLGVNYFYLRRVGHNQGAAVSITATNNLIGLIGHWLLVGGLGLAGLIHIPDRLVDRSPVVYLLPIGLVLMVALIFKRFIRKFLARQLREIMRQLNSFGRRPLSMLGALGSSFGLTLATVGSFWLCVRAIGIDLSFADCLAVFTFGFGLGSAVPTPGGLGGVEAGLVVGLVAYGVTADLALASALLFRLLSYWLVVLMGSLAFVVVQKKKLI